MVTDSAARLALLTRLRASEPYLSSCTDREFAIELVTQGLDVARSQGLPDSGIVAAALADLNSSKPNDELRGLELLDRDLTDFERAIVALEEIGRASRVFVDMYRDAHPAPRVKR